MTCIMWQVIQRSVIKNCVILQLPVESDKLYWHRISRAGSFPRTWLIKDNVLKLLPKDLLLCTVRREIGTWTSVRWRLYPSSVLTSDRLMIPARDYNCDRLTDSQKLWFSKWIVHITGLYSNVFLEFWV